MKLKPASTELAKDATIAAMHCGFIENSGNAKENAKNIVDFYFAILDSIMSKTETERE